MEEIRKILKSILVSTPKKLKVYELNLEYRSIVGSNIPFGKYGYSNLVGFLKSLSDVLSVEGDDVFCTVKVLSGKIAHTKKRKRRKKKSSSKTQDNQIALRSTPIQARLNKVFLLDSNKPGCFQRITQDGILSHISNPSGVNVDMHIDYRNEKMQIAAEIDYGRLAAIKRGFMARELEEAQYGRQAGEKKELRYPKSVVTIERNGEKIMVSPHSVNIENNLNFDQKYISATIMQCAKNSGSVTKHSKNIPSIEAENLETKQIFSIESTAHTTLTNQAEVVASTKTPISLMDEPIPTYLPEVPKAFRQPTPEDLIDFDNVVLNPPSETTRPQYISTTKALPFIEMLRLVKSLNLNGSK